MSHSGTSTGSMASSSERVDRSIASPSGAWNYAFVYDILQRHLPDIPQQARPITRGQARRVLVGRYLDTVVAADRQMIGKVFHVLKWTPRELERTIAALLEEGAARETQVRGEEHPVLLSI